MVNGEAVAQQLDVGAPEDASAASVNLAKLLWLDDEFVNREALSGCLGDRYLCANNKLFAQIRHLFLSFGFCYSTETTRLWRDYDSAPLLMIQDILDAKTVPYKDNAVTLRSISSRSPSLEMSVESLLSLVNRNYLLHESAHCISYHMLASKLKTTELRENKNTYVLVALLCESYANTIERLAAALATSPTHQIFYTMNSYIEPPTGGTFLRDCIRVFGLTKVSAVGMLVFLHYNCHDVALTAHSKRAIFEAASERQRLTESEAALLNALVGNGFGLNRKFRTETTPMFFRYLGCEQEFQQICRALFEPGALSSLGIPDSIADLLSATCDGVDV